MRFPQPFASVVAALVLAAVAETSARAGPAASSDAAPTIVGFAPAAGDANDPRLLSGMIAGPAFTSDGATWYEQTLTWRPRLIRLAPDGSVRAFPLPPYTHTGLTAEGTGVAYAPPGATPVLTQVGDLLFTTAPDGTTIGRSRRLCLDTSTNIVCFRHAHLGRALLTRLTTADSAVLGRDGAVWFTDAEGCRIGRYGPDGSVETFRRGLTPWRSGPQHITSGPDGTLWFTEVRDRIGRVSLDGRITELPVRLPPRSHVGGIVALANGNLWFTLYHGNELARLTPTGVLTRFKRGISPSHGDDYNVPDAVPALDAQGRIWWNEPQGGRMARATLPITSPR